MSSSQNPFSHLIPKNNAGDSGIVGLDDSGDLEETEKWRRRGAIGGKSIKDMITPMSESGGSPPPQNNPFSHLIPSNGGNAQQQPQVDFNKMPFLVRKMMELAPSAMKPVSQGAPERVQALGRGLTDIGEGGKQLYLEKTGSPEEANKYRDQVEAERKFYESTPAGRDPLAKEIREQTSDLPMMAATGPLLSKANLMKKMLMGGASMGAAKGTAFTPEGESRAINTAKGVGMGASIPLVLESANMAAKLGKGIGSTVKNAMGGNVSKAEQLAEQAAAEHEAAIQASNQAKQESGIETGSSNTTGMQRSLNEKQAQLGSMQQPEVGNMPIQSSQASGENLAEMQAAHEQAKADVSNAEKNISQHLNKGAQHDIHVASGILKAQEAERKAASEEYKNIESNLSKNHVELKNPRSAKDMMEEVYQLIREGKDNSPEAKQLMQDLHTHKDSEIVPANDFYKSLRSVQQYAAEARKKAYQVGMNEEERAQWKQRFNDLDEKAESMSKILEEGAGPENMAAIKSANKRWREKVVPLQRNTTYQNIRFQGRMPENIMKTLRGTDPGNVLMRDIIKNDPELLKNVVGQRYANKPSLLQDAGELTQEYLDKMPELKDLIGQHQEAIAALPEHEMSLSKAKEFHEKVLEKEKKAHEHVEKQEKKMEKHADQRQKLEKDIELLNKHIPNLEKASNIEGMSLKQKMAAKKELSDAIAARNKARKILGTIGGSGYLANKIGLLNGIMNSGDNK